MPCHDSVAVFQYNSRDRCDLIVVERLIYRKRIPCFKETNLENSIVVVLFPLSNKKNSVAARSMQDVLF